MVFVHARQAIKVRDQEPNTYLYTIEEKPITRAEAEYNMTKKQFNKAIGEKVAEEQLVQKEADAKI